MGIKVEAGNAAWKFFSMLHFRLSVAAHRRYASAAETISAWNSREANRRPDPIPVAIVGLLPLANEVRHRLFQQLAWPGESFPVAGIVADKEINRSAAART